MYKEISVATGGGAINNFEEINEITPKIFKYILQKNIQKFINIRGIKFNKLLKDIFVFTNKRNNELFTKYNAMMPNYFINEMTQLIAQKQINCSDEDKKLDVYEFLTKYLFGYYPENVKTLQYDLSKVIDKSDIFSDYYKYKQLGLHIHKLKFDEYKKLE